MAAQALTRFVGSLRPQTGTTVSSRIVELRLGRLESQQTRAVCLGTSCASLPEMAYPIRCFDKNLAYFVTSRTMQSRLLLRPSPLVNELIGSVLARAVRKFRIELFDFVFTSNHFHLIARSKTPEEFAGFMQFLQSNIAVKVGRLVNWRGRFWGRRYSAEPILDDPAFLARVRYIKAHGVKERLIGRVQNWPGLTSFPELCGGKVRTFPWRSWTKLWREQRKGGQLIQQGQRFSRECETESETLVLTPFPCWSHMDERGRRSAMNEVVRETNRQHAWVSSKSETQRLREIARQDPHSMPRTTSFLKRPLCHASSQERWLEFVNSLRLLRIAYRSAAQRWLGGLFFAEFPSGCFRPPAWRLAQVSG